MSKYIDKEKLLSRMIAKSILSIDCNENYVTLYGFRKEDVESECVVDVVEVVRCEDCKYFIDCKCNGPFIVSAHGIIQIPMAHNDFCSYGEEKHETN